MPPIQVSIRRVSARRRIPSSRELDTYIANNTRAEPSIVSTNLSHNITVLQKSFQGNFLCYSLSILSFFCGFINAYYGAMYFFACNPIATTLETDMNLAMSYLLLCIGAALIIKSVISFCSTIFKYSNWIIFMSFLFNCVMVYAIIIVFWCTHRISYADIVKALLTQKWQHRETNSEFWDNLQTQFQCCGLIDWQDWGKIIPDSCKEEYQESGCVFAITLFARKNSWSQWHANCCELISYLPYTAIIVVFADVISSFYILKNSNKWKLF